MTSVSVIMPARNAARTIGAAIRSVLAQPSVAQVLVIDDHSTDETGEAVRASDDGRVSILPSPERGIVAALNYGLSNATSDYLARCDADDFYPEGRLAWQLVWLERHPDYIAVSGGFRAISERGELVADLACGGTARDVTADLLSGKTITHLCSWLIRAQAVRQVGGARPWFVTGEDIDLQLRLAAYGKVWHEPRISYIYAIHDNSITHQQKGDLRQFYESSARQFAQQRAQRGYDDLDIGRLPTLPQSNRAPRSSAREHTISLLVGAAWARHHQTKRIAGMRQMLRAIRLNPFKLSLWKGLAMLVIKSR